MNDYPELESAIEKQAEESFNAQYDLQTNFDGNEKKMNDARRRYIREQRDDWFLTTELHSSITIRRDKSVEIHDNYYGSSITVYPPQRDWDRIGDQEKITISPAYINASSWSTGKASVVHVQRRTQQYLKMVEIAMDVQNEMNQPMSEWPNMINPFEQARWDKSELTRYRENERAAIQKSLDEKKAKAEKKAGR